MEGITEEDMVRAWGTPEQYHQELREFLKKHKNADLRTHTSDTGVLVKVEYLFRPFTVVVDNRRLREQIANASK